MAMIPAERGHLSSKSRLTIARLNLETDEPDMGTATIFFASPVSIMPSISERKHEKSYCSEYEMSFSLAPMKCKDMIRLFSEFSRIGQMAKEVRRYRELQDFQKQKLHWECSYEVFKQLQHEAHTFFGCNLKRALKLLGCNTTVKHTTKNGYWVWMK